MEEDNPLDQTAVLWRASDVLRSSGHADGEVERLGPTGVPLALIANAAYTRKEVPLAAGETLVIYTDGIVEATSPDDEEYGLDRLAAVCRQHHAAGAENLSKAIAADLESFARGTPFGDDRTLLIVRRT